MNAMSITHTTIIFDDEDEIADMVTAIARQLGHSAVAVTDEHAFVREYSSSAELIVLDLSMPDFDGIEAIDFLARTEYRGNLVLMSGSTFKFLEIARKLATSKGLQVVSTLEKPFSVAQIMGALELAAGTPSNHERSSDTSGSQMVCDRRQMNLPFRGASYGTSTEGDE